MYTTSDMNGHIYSTTLYFNQLATDETLNLATTPDLFVEDKQLWENPTCEGRLICHEGCVSSLKKSNPINLPRLVKRGAGFPNPLRALIGSNQLWRDNDSRYEIIWHADTHISCTNAKILMLLNSLVQRVYTVSPSGLQYYVKIHTLLNSWECKF